MASLNWIIKPNLNIIYFPNIKEETFTVDSTSPSRTADNSLTYDTDAGERLIAEWRTSAKDDSNIEFWKVYQYLRGRAGVSETVYLDRLKSTIEAYVRVTGFDTMFEGARNDRREVSIQVWQK